MSPTALAAGDIAPTAPTEDASGPGPIVIVDRLAAFLDHHSLGSGPLRIGPLGEGHSNITLSIDRGDLRMVLRRPPRGPLPPSAHDVVREARALTFLDGEAKVPEVLAVCEDPEVVGAPFFLMRRIEGHSITDRLPPDLDRPGDRGLIGPALIDALVEIHAVDWRAAGLQWLGRPDGYLERQIRRFSGLWNHNRTRELVLLDEVTGWLGEHLPGSPPSTVVHGDFRLGNAIMARAPSGPQVRSVLDWEMATIGDPLADLGYLTALWISPGDQDFGVLEGTTVTREEGFSNRAELVGAYAERTARPVSAIAWYQTFALWKAAIFTEGNHRRALAEHPGLPGTEALGETVVCLTERAAAIGPEEY